jgi:hypothetical protein
MAKVLKHRILKSQREKVSGLMDIPHQVHKYFPATQVLTSHSTTSSKFCQESLVSLVKIIGGLLSVITQTLDRKCDTTPETPRMARGCFIYLNPPRKVKPFSEDFIIVIPRLPQQTSALLFALHSFLFSSHQRRVLPFS